ncbi:MAG TPA: RidA family protein [Chloroflexota bacterium]|nr:RidA family protein [Chloroflexota bacterium]
MALVGLAAGNYRYLTGSSALPFCGGVIADAGYEIVRATLRRPIPWREGFAAIERHLAGLGRPRTALCAVELRCAKPYTREEFFSKEGFNGQYGERLREWGLVVDGLGATARTNIAVDLVPLAEQVIFAFSYTVPAADAPPTFVVSGVPEAATLRPGDTSPEALREKTRDVMTTLDQRLSGLGASWDQVTAMGLYTIHDLFPALHDEVLAKAGAAALNGIQWYYGQPPVQGGVTEIDVRGIQREMRVG